MLVIWEINVKMDLTDRTAKDVNGLQLTQDRV
jgi:hypothetical protein